MTINWNGLAISLLMAIASGTAFTQDLPATANDWWKFATGFAVATALQYIAWQRQHDERKVILTEAEREELRAAKARE